MAQNHHKKNGVVYKSNPGVKLEHLEQTGTEIGTVIGRYGIKNRECSSVPILLIKRCMGEKKEKK